MKKFKKNQRIIATLPSGRKVEGYYLEPFGDSGHSFYVLEFNGIGKGGQPVYKKAQYGVKDEFISEMPKDEKELGSLQYKAWLKRAIDLETRIKESEEAISKMADCPDKTKEEKKLERNKSKLSQINAKIEEYENQ